MKTDAKIRCKEQEIRRAQAKFQKLKKTLEDLEDSRALARAKKRNAGKPGTPWEVVAKELGIRPPPKKRPRKVRRA